MCTFHIPYFYADTLNFCPFSIEFSRYAAEKSGARVMHSSGLNMFLALREMDSGIFLADLLLTGYPSKFGSTN